MTVAHCGSDSQREEEGEFVSILKNALPGDSVVGSLLAAELMV